MTHVARIQGCLFGLACGDALGYPTEFLSLAGIHGRYGPQGIQELPTPALFSDDTQMTLAVARALAQAGEKPLSEIGEALANEFMAWYEDPENTRAPGNACLKGCEALRSGVSWRLSGERASKGCGANMRVAPIGLRYCSDTSRLSAVAHLSALITHAHPAALAAAEATALCVAWGTQDVVPAECLDRLARHAEHLKWDGALGDPWTNGVAPLDNLRRGWDELLVVLGRVPQALRDQPEDYCRRLGGGWVADEALACALYCFLSHPDNYTECVRLGANSSGDSDSIACIAGAISGARLGMCAVPEPWRQRIEKADRLQQIARALADNATAAQGVTIKNGNQRATE